MQPDYDGSTERDASAKPDDCIHLVASRREALESLRRAALAIRHGPVLITGEPGAGKTRLMRRFGPSAPTRLANRERRSGRGDERPRVSAPGRPSARRLGEQPTGQGANSPPGRTGRRIHRGPALAAGRQRGASWPLGGLGRGAGDRESTGRPRGFAALFVVGATDLPRTLVSRRSSIGLAAQISSHIHLKPIDLDEARELLEAAGGNDVGRRSGCSRSLHRKSRGNTALLLRLAQAWNRRSAPGAASGSALREGLCPQPRAPCVSVAGHSSDLEAEARPDLVAKW